MLVGFPGGAVVENLPAKARDMGLSPGLGRSHMLWSNLARAPQLLSLCSVRNVFLKYIFKVIAAIHRDSFDASGQVN